MLDSNFYFCFNPSMALVSRGDLTAHTHQEHWRLKPGDKMARLGRTESPLAMTRGILVEKGSPASHL